MRGGGYGVWRRLKVLFRCICRNFRTPPHGVESLVSSDFFQPLTPTVVGGRGGDARSLTPRCSATCAIGFGDVATHCGVIIHIVLLSSCPEQQQQLPNLERLRFHRRGTSTPLWGVEACSLPKRWPNPIPAIPPSVVRTHHLHGAPAAEETSTVEL